MIHSVLLRRVLLYSLILIASMAIASLFSWSTTTTKECYPTMKNAIVCPLVSIIKFNPWIFMAIGFGPAIVLAAGDIYVFRKKKEE